MPSAGAGESLAGAVVVSGIVGNGNGIASRNASGRKGSVNGGGVFWMVGCASATAGVASGTGAEGIANLRVSVYGEAKVSACDEAGVSGGRGATAEVRVSNMMLCGMIVGHTPESGPGPPPREPQPPSLDRPPPPPPPPP